MVLAIRKKPLYQMAFTVSNALSESLAGKGIAIMLGFENGLESSYDCFGELHGVTDLPGTDILFASTMIYYGLPIFLAVNLVDKGIGAIEFGSSLMSDKSQAEKASERLAERQQAQEGISV